MAMDDTPAAPGRPDKVAAGALFGVSVLHLPLLYLLIRTAEGAPPFAIVPFALLSMGAAWGSGLLIERQPHGVPKLAGVLSVLELPLVLAFGRGLGGVAFLGFAGGVSVLGAVALAALIREDRARQSR